MVPPSQSSLKGAWSLLMLFEPSHTTLKPLAGMVPKLLGNCQYFRLLASLLRYIPPRFTACSLGLYNSIQLSKFVAGLITFPAFEAISSLITTMMDKMVDHIMFR